MKCKNENYMYKYMFYKWGIKIINGEEEEEEEEVGYIFIGVWKCVIVFCLILIFSIIFFFEVWVFV